MEQKHGEFTLTFSPTTGKWTAEDVEGNEVDHDANYKDLIARLDKRAKNAVKRFEAYYQRYQEFKKVTVTSVSTDSKGYYRGLECWISDGSSHSKARAASIYLPTKDNTSLGTRIQGIAQQIGTLNGEREELVKQLKSLAAMVDDTTCHLPEVEQIRRFLGKGGS